MKNIILASIFALVWAFWADYRLGVHENNMSAYVESSREISAEVSYRYQEMIYEREKWRNFYKR